MGGGISVTSDAGRGSCFSIRVLAELAPADGGREGPSAAPLSLAPAI